MKTVHVAALAAAALTAASPTPAVAAAIFALELSRDIRPLFPDIRDLPRESRDLPRPRSGLDPSDLTDRNDAVIEQDRADRPREIPSGRDGSDRRFIDWIRPTDGSVLSAVLTASAWGADRQDAFVVPDRVRPGLPNSDSSDRATAILQDAALLIGPLSDRQLDILLREDGRDRPRDLRAPSVYSPQLDVRLEPVPDLAVVPEPASLVALGMGLVAIAAYARRRKP